MTRNQASGGDSVRAARSHALRHSAAENRATPVGSRPCRASSVTTEASGRQPVIWVQAVTHFWNGTQSLFPLSHCASGVFQNLMVLK